jgi:DNA-binding NarL/FixJ family response regulator
MRVVIAEDNGLLLDSLAMALPQRGVTVVGQAGNLPEVLDVVERTRPDVAILDIRMPPTGTDEGIRAAERIRATHPDIGLLVLSEHPVASYAQRLLTMDGGSRAIGYLVKFQVGNIDRLLGALTRVADGEIVIDSAVVDRLMARPRPPSPLDRLTPQERRVLSLMAQGRSNIGIARHLSCAEGTVEKHVSTINSKLGLRTPQPSAGGTTNLRVLAVLTYLRSNPSALTDHQHADEPL